MSSNVKPCLTEVCRPQQMRYMMPLKSSIEILLIWMIRLKLLFTRGTNSHYYFPPEFGVHATIKRMYVLYFALGRHAQVMSKYYNDKRWQYLGCRQSFHKVRSSEMAIETKHELYSAKLYSDHLSCQFISLISLFSLSNSSTSIFIYK